MRGTHAVLAGILGLLLGAEALGAEGKGSPPAKAPAKAAPPAPSAAAKQGLDLLEKGRVEDAEKLLREALAADGADAEARLTLGRVLDWDGRPDEALKTWEEGLLGKAGDVPLLSAMARLHLRRAADGPLVTRRRGAMSISPGRKDVDEEKFAKSHREAALDLWKRAAALRPADRELGLAVAGVLSDLERYAEAVPAFEALAKSDPKNVDVLVGWSAALLLSGRTEDAKARADQALKLAPRHPAAHEALGDCLNAMGKMAEGDVALRKALLYGWLPPFSKLEFSEPLYKKVATVAKDPFMNAEDEADAKRMWDEKRAVVDAALAAKDEPAYDLLTAICWNHCAHGPIEDSCFAALEARGKPSVPVFLKMLEDGHATCTTGAAARALARMKEATAFEAIARQLPKDVHPIYPMDIAGALVLLADRRAVPHLVAAMDVDAPPAPKEKPEEKRKGRGVTVVIGGPAGAGEEGGMDGRPAARARAALAVGEFDVPEARAALEKGCGNPEIAAYCHAALWRLTKDEKAHGRAVADAMNGEGIAKFLIGPYLDRIDHPNAKYLAEAWKKEQESKKR